MEEGNGILRGVGRAKKRDGEKGGKGMAWEEKQDVWHSLGGDVWREIMEWRRGGRVEGDRGMKEDGREEEKGIGKRGIGKSK